LYPEKQCFICNLNKNALQKLNKSIGKNPELITFINQNDFEHKLKTLYAPLVSIDVERSFSKYKRLLTDRRTGFNSRKYWENACNSI
jgi:hypothetical protein